MPHRHGFSRHFNGAGCIPTMRGGCGTGKIRGGHRRPLVLQAFRPGRVLINPERSQTWRCPRYPRKRTSGLAFGTSVLCHKSGSDLRLEFLRKTRILSSVAVLAPRLAVGLRPQALETNPAVAYVPTRTFMMNGWTVQS